VNVIGVAWPDAGHWVVTGCRRLLLRRPGRGHTQVASVAFVWSFVDGASGGVRSEADDTVPSLADSCCWARDPIDFGQFLFPASFVGVAGWTWFFAPPIFFRSDFRVGRLWPAGKASRGQPRLSEFEFNPRKPENPSPDPTRNGLPREIPPTVEVDFGVESFSSGRIG